MKVLIDNLSYQGPSAAILDLAANRVILMFISPAVLTEYEAVLRRPPSQARSFSYCQIPGRHSQHQPHGQAHSPPDRSPGRARQRVFNRFGDRGLAPCCKLRPGTGSAGR